MRRISAGDLDDVGRQPHREPDPPSQIVGADRVVDQATTIGADKAADLVAGESNALDQRPDCGSNVTNTTSILS